MFSIRNLIIASLVVSAAVSGVFIWLTRFYSLNLAEAGQIGDSVGGVVGTVAAVLSTVVVYGAFREQIVANRELADQNQRLREAELLDKAFDRLREDVEAIRYGTERDHGGKKVGVLFEGRAAIETFAEDFCDAPEHAPALNSPFFDDLYFLVGTFDTLRRRIVAAPLPDADRFHLVRSLCFLYTNKFMIGMTQIMALADHGGLNLTVKDTGMNRYTHFQAILSAHRKMMEFITSSQQ
jgi:hypothetical protein